MDPYNDPEDYAYRYHESHRTHFRWARYRNCETILMFPRCSGRARTGSYINPPVHRTPYPSEILASRQRPTLTSESECSYLQPSTSPSYDIPSSSYDISSSTSRNTDYHPAEDDPEMADHYHPYRTANANSPDSYLSPEYHSGHYPLPGPSKRRSTSRSRTYEPVDSSDYVSYSRPVSLMYPGYATGNREASTSPYPGYELQDPFSIPSGSSMSYAAYTSNLSCGQCGHMAVNSDALARHQHKHFKIHYCRFQNCSRTEGFATSNDRERHEKSVHKIPGQYWKCMDQDCSSYGKEFSRRDNLKDHLRRMHPVPNGMCDSDANVWRSRLADMWRFEKGSGRNSPERGDPLIDPAAFMQGPVGHYYG